MRVEQTWPPDQRASADQFLSRLEIFPEGFWVGEYDDSIVGLTTSCLQHYDPYKLEQFSSWNQAINNGYLYRDIKKPNALYIVSTIIIKEHRGEGLFDAFLKKHQETTRKLGLDYSVTGIVIPGYNAYCLEYGEIPIYQYANLRHLNRLVDPLLRKAAALGFKLPDERHLIPHYYQSTESRDYAALLVYQNRGVKKRR
ncbi:MAG TPA: GNAT family N-acetyltransferase [Smithellaceae bacterium]|nr:GNAT family N-acetyltransferase [Smithellaceae bacterium]HPL68538.1 GNAT family N-acetyltransferase [Smithellaceae bacterium]